MPPSRTGLEHGSETRYCIDKCPHLKKTRAFILLSDFQLPGMLADREHRYLFDMWNPLQTGHFSTNFLGPDHFVVLESNSSTRSASSWMFARSHEAGS